MDQPIRTRARTQFTRNLPSSQSGFTLIETMMSVIIMAGGLLALASGLSQGMLILSTSHYHQIAKEKASEAIESVSTARDTRVITWAQIRNVRDGGIFFDGEQLLRTRGPDGLVNTADDGAVETETLPGPDKILGTADDIVVPLDTFTRQMEITDLATNLRQIRVTVRYRIGHLTRQYEVISYVSSFA